MAALLGPGFRQRRPDAPMPCPALASRLRGPAAGLDRSASTAEAWMALINLKDWSLVPGPLADPPPSSVHLQDIAAYPPRLVAEAFLAFPGMRVRHPAEPTWWNWIARWEQCERWIEVGFTLFEVEPPAWGGSDLRGHCTVSDILGLWRAVRSRVPACWMHN